MKVLVILCIAAHFANAVVPPFTTLLSGAGGGLGSILGSLNPLGFTSESEDDDQKNTESGPLGRFGGIFGSNPRQVAGDFLGVKVNLLSALRSTILDETNIDLVDNSVGGSAAIDGTGANLSGFGESSGGAAEISSQAFSSGSAFAQMGSIGGELSVGHTSEHASGQSVSSASSGGYSNQQNLAPPPTSYGTPDLGNGNAASGYNYNRPPAGYAPQVQNAYIPPSTGSGYAANNGYSYSRPAPVQNSYIPPSTGSGYAANNGYSYSRPAPVQNTYGPPSTGSGYAANGGYNYNRPAPVQNTYGPPSTGSGYANRAAPVQNSYLPPQNSYGPPQNSYGPPNGNYASQSSSLESSSGSSSQISGSGSVSADFGPPSSGTVSEVSFSQVGGETSEFSSEGGASTSQSNLNRIQATQSGAAGLSASGSGSATVSGGSGSSQRNGLQGIANSIIRSGVQVPISLLSSYRSGVNRGFDALVNGIGALQQIFAGGAGASADQDHVDEINTDSRIDDSASFNFDSSNDFRRRF